MFTKSEIIERILIARGFDDEFVSEEKKDNWPDSKLELELLQACGMTLIRMSYNQYMLN
jgi:hypothetical protein